MGVKMNTFYIQHNVNDTGLITTYYLDNLPQHSATLRVPFHAQWEADARKWKSDCGPANVEMVGEYYRGPSSTTTDDIMKWITGGVNRNTSAGELVEAAQHFYDVKLTKTYNTNWDFLKSEIDKGYPLIVLVHYGAFIMRLDRGFTGGHWMTVKGFDIIDYQGTKVERIILHDPDWWGNYTTQGADIPVIKKHFMDMWGQCYLDDNPNYMVLTSRGE